MLRCLYMELLFLENSLQWQYSGRLVKWLLDPEGEEEMQRSIKAAIDAKPFNERFRTTGANLAR